MTSPTTRRRGDALDAAIFAAVYEELAAVGYAGVTFEGVARRAHTSKPVLYRRWPSRAEMVFAALAHSASELAVTIDGDSLRSDLRLALRTLRDRIADIGRETLLGLLLEMPADHARAVQDLVSQRGDEVACAVVERARARGEMGAASRPRRLLELPFDLVRAEFIMNGEVSDETIDAIVDEVVIPAYA